jgi:hypothetical protein
MMDFVMFEQYTHVMVIDWDKTMRKIFFDTPS